MVHRKKPLTLRTQVVRERLRRRLRKERQQELDQINKDLEVTPLPFTEYETIIDDTLNTPTPKLEIEALITFNEDPNSEIDLDTVFNAKPLDENRDIDEISEIISEYQPEKTECFICDADLCNESGPVSPDTEAADKEVEAIMTKERVYTPL